MLQNIQTAPQDMPADIAWEKIRKLKPLILAHRAEADQLRRLPDAIAAAFLENDIYRLSVPEDFGGLELDPLTVFDLGVEISSYDGSTGWNFVIGTSTTTLWGMLPVARMREVFGVPDCCVAGSGAPPGKAVAVPGGYLVSGRWSWGSGIHQAKWVSGSATIYDGEQPRLENGKPAGRLFLMPKDQVDVLDIWYTGGLRGTGSTDWEVSEFFVPEQDACQPFTGHSTHTSPNYRLPGTYFGMGLCSVALGVALSATKGLKEFAMQTGSKLRDQGYAQYAVARAEALYESNHLNVREAFRVIWDNVLANRPHSLAERARARRSYVLAVEASIEAVALCSDAAGGAAVFESLPFQRATRDVNAVRGHIVLSRRFMEEAGKAELGIQPSDYRF